MFRIRKRPNSTIFRPVISGVAWPCTPANSTNSIASDESSRTKPGSQRRALELLRSAIKEVRTAHQHMGWSAEGFAMRLVMLISSRSNSKTTGVPEEAIVVDQVETPVEKITEWERLLRWAHASYGWNERGVARRTGLQPGEIELIKFSPERARGRAMVPTYVLAVDHRHEEIVLSVRGTKAFGDVITVSHFLPEPFLDGYAHRGFAQSAHELVKEIQPELTDLRKRLPNYRITFTGHSMGGGIAAMASLLIRDSAAQGAEEIPRRDLASWQSGARKDPHVQGVLDGPEVVSFATPCCVSLELARRCQTWVKSIVYADDAVPRLSTVSLDLLKESMTAEEWERAVDRLARLSNPSLFSTESITGAIKGVAAKFDVFGRTMLAGVSVSGGGSSDFGSVRVVDGAQDAFCEASSGSVSSLMESGNGGRPTSRGFEGSGNGNGCSGMEGCGDRGVVDVELDADPMKPSGVARTAKEAIQKCDDVGDCVMGDGAPMRASDVGGTEPRYRSGLAAVNGADDAKHGYAISIQKGVELHNMLSAREEPSYLPLYPPGDPFLMCNAARAGASVSKDMINRVRPSDSSVFHGANGDSAGVHGAARSCGDEPTSQSSCTVQTKTWSIEYAIPAVPSVERERLGELATAAAEDSIPSQGKGECVQGARVDTKMTGENASRGVVLVRVPHQHFLRMPLTPSMISDHLMSAYRYGLAGLKERAT